MRPVVDVAAVATASSRAPCSWRPSPPRAACWCRPTRSRRIPRPTSLRWTSRRRARRLHEQTGQISLGGQVGTLDDAADLGTSAVTTPYGLVFFADDQAVRLLGADGEVSTLAPAPERPGPFTPSVRYDKDQRRWPG